MKNITIATLLITALALIPSCAGPAEEAKPALTPSNR